MALVTAWWRRARTSTARPAIRGRADLPRPTYATPPCWPIRTPHRQPGLYLFVEAAGIGEEQERRPRVDEAKPFWPRHAHGSPDHAPTFIQWGSRFPQPAGLRTDSAAGRDKSGDSIDP